MSTPKLLCYVPDCVLSIVTLNLMVTRYSTVSCLQVVQARSKGFWTETHHLIKNIALMQAAL
jgi:hypothetical protein